MDLAADWDAVPAKGGAQQKAQPVAGDLASEWDALPATKAQASKTIDPSKAIPDTLVEAHAPAQPQGRLERYDRSIKGPLEAALSIGTGLIAAPVGAAAGIVRGFTGGKYGTPEGAQEASRRAAEVQRFLTYVPRGEAGRDALESFGKIVDESKLAGLGPTEAMTVGSLASTGPRVRALQLPREVVRGVGETVGSYRPSTIASTMRGTESKGAASPAVSAVQGGSAGAAGTNLAEQAKAISANASPELQAIVAQVGQNITPRGLEALERQVKANKFGIDLSEGQATRNAVQITKERNSVRDQDRLRFQEQDKKLREAPQVIQEVVAPDVYVANPSEIGDLIIGGYQKKGSAMRADTSARYKALEDANGGQFPLDARALVKNADEALHKRMLFEHVPDKIRAQLSKIEKDGLTFEQFEAMRTNLAAIQRGANPEKSLERAAAGVIRNEMEKLPMPAGAEHLKPLADAARASSKAYHDAMKADPTFKAVERGKAKADNFIQKYIVRGDVDSKDVAKMKENLAHDPIAQQAMAAGVIQKLKESAGILRGEESFSQANYNKALAKLGSKVDAVFSPEGRALVRELGDVAHDVKFYPHGHAVNTSGSGIMVLGEIAKAGGAAIEGMAEAKGIPAGFMRRAFAKRKENKALDRAFQRGAGITIKDVAEAANR